MCRARRRQSRESRDEPPRGNVRRGGACVGSVPAANKEGGRLLVVKLGESLLESPSDGRRAPPPIPLVRLAAHRELRQRVYRPQVFVVHRHKRVLLQHLHGLPLCAAQQVERDRRRVEKRHLAQRRVRRLPVPRLLDLSPRQHHNGVEAQRTIVPAQQRQVRCAHPDAAAFTELYSPALSLCVVLEQLAMLPIMLGGIQ